MKCGYIRKNAATTHGCGCDSHANSCEHTFAIHEGIRVRAELESTTNRVDEARLVTVKFEAAGTLYTYITALILLHSEVTRGVDPAAW